VFGAKKSATCGSVQNCHQQLVLSAIYRNEVGLAEVENFVMAELTDFDLSVSLPALDLTKL
jgi:hypothetical protein